MKKKQVSVRIDEDLYSKIDDKTNELGISKSAFVAFATQFFMHQLEYSERSSRQYSVNVYELIKANIELQNQNK